MSHIGRKEYCIDCKKELCPYNHSLRCRSCNTKNLWKNKEWSKKAREQMSKSAIGKIVSEVTREKISKTLKEKTANGEHYIPGFSGDKHWNWQGGKSLEPYGQEFDRKLKEQIRERDNFTCQECEIHQSLLKYKLTIHHIDYNKHNNFKNNLISLCKSCHTKLHLGIDKRGLRNKHDKLIKGCAECQI